MKIRRCHNKGAILVMTASFIVVGIALAALVVDIGLFYLARRELEGVTELAGRAAIVRFHELQNATYQQRITAAITRAQEIAQSNQIRGLGGVPLGALGTTQQPGESGSLEFGQYFETLPACENGLCPALTCGQLPCFQPAPSTGGVVNAVRVRLSTANSRPIATTFGKILGINSIHMNAERLVVIAPRCAVFLVDLSNSMTVDNYRPFNIADPNLAGMGGAFSYYAFTEEAVDKGTLLFNAVPVGVNPATMNFTQVSALFSGSTNPLVQGQTKASLAWFSLLAHKRYRPLGAPSPAQEHYADDYVLTQIKFGNQHRPYYIDAYHDATHQGPEPFRTIMEVLHNLIKHLRQSALTTDYIQIAGFDYDIRGSDLVSRDSFALLQQVTNLENGPYLTSGGLRDEIHPNFTDYGLLPREDAPTNIFEPLYVAIENLSDSTMCPANAEKNIFVISDFLFNMVPDGVASLAALRNPTGPYRFVQQFQLESSGNYAYFSDQYLGWEFMFNWIFPGPTANPVLHPVGTRTSPRWPLAAQASLPEILQEAGGGIRLHTVIVGDHVGPHMLDWQDPNWLGTYQASGRYKFPDYLTGLGRFPNLYPLANDFGVNYPRIFDGSYGNPSMGANYHPFPRPNWTAYWMASNLNGMFCPLRPPPPPSECIEDPFDSTRRLHDEFNHRSHNTPEYFSPDCTSKTEQFTRCVQDTFVRGVPVYPVAEYNN